MCSPAVCRRCNKATYSGCGMHVDQVLRGVPADQRCDCDSRTSSVTGSTSGDARTSWWARRRG